MLATVSKPMALFATDVLWNVTEVLSLVADGLGLSSYMEEESKRVKGSSSVKVTEFHALILYLRN